MHEHVVGVITTKHDGIHMEKVFTCSIFSPSAVLGNDEGVVEVPGHVAGRGSDVIHVPSDPARGLPVRPPPRPPHLHA